MELSDKKSRFVENLLRSCPPTRALEAIVQAYRKASNTKLAEKASEFSGEIDAIGELKLCTTAEACAHSGVTVDGYFYTNEGIERNELIDGEKVVTIKSEVHVVGQVAGHNAHTTFETNGVVEVVLSLQTDIEVSAYHDVSTQTRELVFFEIVFGRSRSGRDAQKGEQSKEKILFHLMKF